MSTTLEVPPARLYTTLEVARILGVTPRTVANLRSRGTLPASKLGRSVRFDPEDVRRLVSASRDGGQQ